VQEISPKYLIADFDKIMKKHDTFVPTQFNNDAHYKRCVSEVSFSLICCNILQDFCLVSSIYILMRPGNQHQGGPGSEAEVLYYTSAVHVSVNYRASRFPAIICKSTCERMITRP
jgi:hypothetical protein